MSDIELTKKQNAKIQRAVKALNDVRKEIQRENPDYYLNWYLEDSNNLNLMEDHSHTGGDVANFDAVIECFNLELAGGGGW